MNNIEQSIEERVKWADYYVSLLRAAKLTGAADWLKETHGSRDNVFIQSQLDSFTQGKE